MSPANPVASSIPVRSDIAENFGLRYSGDPFMEAVEDLDVSKLGVAGPRPDLNGKLLRLPTGGVYLVDEGRARAYTAEALFVRVHGWNLYRHGCNFDGCRWYWTPTRFTEVLNLDFIDLGPAFADDVRLVRSAAGAVFLYENHAMRLVASSQVVIRYQFITQHQVQIYSDEVLNNIPIVGTIQDN